jgi:hypothetical protein
MLEALAHVSTDAAHCGSANEGADEVADGEIRKAWARWRDKHKQLQALPALPALAGELYSAKEQRLWKDIAAAEEAIRSRIATSPHGVAIQLYVALMYQGEGHLHEQALIEGDFDPLDVSDKGLDWGTRMTLAALRSLEAMATN